MDDELSYQLMKIRWKQIWLLGCLLMFLISMFFGFYLVLNELQHMQAKDRINKHELYVVKL